jgi:AcrR family transcriptional regulator
MNKRKDTKQMILVAGLEMASEIGLEAVSIGALAKSVEMSKSGLFAHFKAKETLQKDILEYAGDLFAQAVVVPSLRVESGIPRLQALVDNWVIWSRELPGGCIFMRAINDLQAKPGAVRDYLMQQQRVWLDVIKRVVASAVAVEDLRTDTDVDQFSSEFYSLMLGYNLYGSLLADGGMADRRAEAVSALFRRHRSLDEK